MTLKTSPASFSSPLRMTLVLETLSSGNIFASLLEFPQCRVEAESREVAIEQVRADAVALLNRIEVLPLEFSADDLEGSDSPWIKYAGMFEDDLDFAEIAAALRAERESDDETELDPRMYTLTGQAISVNYAK